MSTKDDHLKDEVMCACSGTTRGQIQNLFKEGLDIEAISRWTGALSGCAGCEWDVAEFLKELAEQQKE
ncbi:MAG: (2Fe-2S)-binding protein [Methylotenera sp.]